MAAGQVLRKSSESAQSGADYWVDRIVTNGSLVISFGRAITSEGGFEHAQFLECVVQRHDRPFHRILLRDTARSGYYQGVAGLGRSVEEVAASLHLLITELSPSEVIAFGTGLGGHAALVYGILLGVQRIVAIDPPAHLIAEDLVRHNDHRWHAELSELPEETLARRYDVVTLASQTSFKGRAFILFGTQHANEHADAVHLDVLHAHWLARAEQVTLFPYVGPPGNFWESHPPGDNVEDVLRRYFFEKPASSSTAPPPAPVEDCSPQMIPLQHYHFDLTLISIDKEDLASAGGDSLNYAAAGKLEVPTQRKINDGWRSWIAENLILGASPNSVRDTLVTHGIQEAEASAEILDALRSPYFWGSQRLCNRLKKRDWLLTAYRKLQRLRPRAAEVDRRCRLSRAEFFQDYYTACRPVVITGMMDDWPALKRWNFEDLLRQFGDRTVEVVNDPAGNPRGTSQREGAVNPLTLAGRLELMRNGVDPQGNLVLSIGDVPANQALLTELWDDVGPIPEYLDEQARPPRLLRLGVELSVLPFHHGVSNVFHAQVMGSVRVKMVPPWDLPFMRNLRHTASELDGRTIPAASLSALDRPQILDCLLKPGDLLFLPIGTWLFLEGLEPFAALSLTHFAFDNDFESLFPHDQIV